MMVTMIMFVVISIISRLHCIILHYTILLVVLIVISIVSERTTACKCTLVNHCIGFPLGIIRENWNDAENISTAPAQG